MNDPKNRLIARNLRVTPQRIAVMEAIDTMRNHPTAEKIIAYVHRKFPNIAAGTVYKVLETLTEKKLIAKVTTERDIMRYDGVIEAHHHLYCSESDRIEDYYDEELNRRMERYFMKKRIPGFEIEDIQIQITGKFSEHQT
jgi:Fur family transcriptional regulator, peroxide stress response regulator